jgi:hypothetical protein
MIRLKSKGDFMKPDRDIETTVRLNTVFAPRIVRQSERFDNLFANLGNEGLTTPYGEFHFRGGHRLWHSPEAMPRTYIPDVQGVS